MRDAVFIQPYPPIRVRVDRQPRYARAFERYDAGMMPAQHYDARIARIMTSAVRATVRVDVYNQIIAHAQTMSYVAFFFMINILYQHRCWRADATVYCLIRLMTMLMLDA